MKNEDLSKKIESINKTLGKENAAKIADVLGEIITDTKNVNETIEKKDKEITTLKNDKDVLMTTNANLLKQVGVIDEIETPTTPKKKEEEKLKMPFNFGSVFDANGNFKNQM